MANDTTLLQFDFNNHNIEANRIIECKINQKQIVKISISEDQDILDFYYLIVSGQDGEESIIDSKKQVIKNLCIEDVIFFIFTPKPLRCFLANDRLKEFHLAGKTLTLKIEYAARENNPPID